MKLTAHFDSGEFSCRDGSIVPERLMPNLQRLADQLEILRGYIAKPIVIISGYRTPKHNAKVKGAKSSQHLLAAAADIRISGMSPPMVKTAIDTLIKMGRMRDGGVGVYATWLHYDTGPVRRWNG